MALTQEQLQNIMQAALAAVQGQSQAVTTESRPRLKPPERPEVDLGFSETQWAFFEDEFKLYKRRAALQPNQVIHELRACCSKELRKTLFDFVGSSVIDAFTEDQLLAKIREMAVIGKNKAVHRKEFYEIVQAPDELLNRFVSKLRAKAERCNFTMKCTRTGCETVINYGEEMLRDQVTTGLYDTDVQQEVLAKSKDLTTFEQVYSHIEAYEQGKRAKAELKGHSEVNAARSQYKKNQSDGRGEAGSKKCLSLIHI